MLQKRKPRNDRNNKMKLRAEEERKILFFIAMFVLLILIVGGLFIYGFQNYNKEMAKETTVYSAPLDNFTSMIKEVIKK